MQFASTFQYIKWANDELLELGENSFHNYQKTMRPFRSDFKSHNGRG